MEQKQINKIILDGILPLIDNNYILLDLPYFTNVGDVLIWQSTLDILRNCKHKCIYSASIDSYRKPEIAKDIVILFMGGGNFGDLWKRHQLFREMILNDFPENPIVQLPQSVSFKDILFLNQDKAIFSGHKGKITICLRDLISYNYIKLHYHTVEVKLLPDMVLGFDVSKYTKHKRGHGILYVERNDPEKKTVEYTIPQNAVVKDWPTMQKKLISITIYNRLMHYLIMIDKRFNINISKLAADYCYKRVFKNLILISGIDFINQYQTIYSTRLHAAILAALLGKEVYMSDNSYGKIKGVYDLWMKELPHVKMI